METLRILAADDEPGMLMAVERVLRSLTIRLPDLNGDVRFTIDTAATGEDALDKIHAQPPHILLLDYKLPGISGLDVLDRIAAEPGRDILTIMMTAYASLETAVTATKRGAYDFLAKPFTPDELKNTVRKAAASLVLAQQARKLAEEKRQVRFQFISVLAHELKAPLAAVEGYLRIIKGQTAGDDPAVYNRMLGRSLIRLEGMRKMILDLLDLTHIESGKKKRDITQIDVRDIAQLAIEGVAPDADQRHIAIQLQAPQSVPMLADSNEIEIILNNLISNAVKYNRDGGKVDITLSQDTATTSPRTTIQVADTGIGMTPDDAARLFNDFVRIKNEKTVHILGSGLGLSIVKKLARLYDGDVAVASEPDVGSTFTVVLGQPVPEPTPADKPQDDHTA